MFADELDKSASAEVGLLNVIFAAIKLDEFLGVLIADRNYQSPAGCQLVDQFSGNRGSTGCHNNRVKGTLLPPAFGSIGISRYNIVIVEFVKKMASLDVQRADALDGIHAIHDLGQDSCLITGAGADFKNPIILIEFQGLGHFRNNVGLRDGLLLSNRQRVVTVGLISQSFADEQMPRNFAKRGQNPGILDAPGLNLFAHHLLALALVFEKFIFHLCLPYFSIKILEAGQDDSVANRDDFKNHLIFL